MQLKKFRNQLLEGKAKRWKRTYPAFGPLTGWKGNLPKVKISLSSGCISLFVRVDDAMLEAVKHSQAKLFPSEVVTLGLLYALKGVGERAFYRFAERD